MVCYATVVFDHRNGSFRDWFINEYVSAALFIVDRSSG